MQWYWGVLIFALAIVFPFYVKILAEFAYRGKVRAMKKLFKKEEKR